MNLLDFNLHQYALLRKIFRDSYSISPENWYNHKSGTFMKNKRKQAKINRRRKR